MTLNEKQRVYLGIDPGRSKTGLALVDASGAILALHIAATVSLREELARFTSACVPSVIVMGDGTNSARLREVVRDAFPATSLELVGEAHSTEEARTLYWQAQPPKGWRRLVPLGLLVPPEPLDAYAAVVQVRRWLARQ
jgi:hypothetical protein